MVETLAENRDIEAVGERHLVRESDEDLPEQSGSFLNVDLITQFAVFDTSADDVAPEPELLFHPFVELVLAVGIIEEHLLEEVKVTGIGQLSGHFLALNIAQPHDLGHGALHTLDVFVDEIAQRPV